MRPVRVGDYFADRVVKAPSGCWVWTGHVTANGYGRYSAGGRAGGQAHRLAYEMYVGPIPEGYELDHLCRYRRCVNPLHLEAVTHAENMRRSSWAYRSTETPPPSPADARIPATPKRRPRRQREERKAPSSPPRVLSLAEAADQLKVSRRTAYRLAAEGRFPVTIVRVGGQWRVPAQAVARFLEGVA